MPLGKKKSARSSGRKQAKPATAKAGTAKPGTTKTRKRTATRASAHAKAHAAAPRRPKTGSAKRRSKSDGASGRPASGTTRKPRRAKAPTTSLPGPKLARLLLNLEENLAKRIVGKDDAIERIARVVRVRMTQLDFRPDRPKGSFLLVGPSGVGKNELAYALAEALYGSEEYVVSLDLGELAEEGDLAKLGVTMVPGSDTQAMEGLLTSPVRRNPEAIVLLRGLERAHPAFQPLLQQILERGKIEDMLGPVSFSDTVIFVTTRPRREETSAGEIGFSRPLASHEEALRKRLEKAYAPDLLDAFCDIIELTPLSPEAVRNIARYKVEAVLRRLESRRRIDVDDTVYAAFLPDEEATREGVALLHRTLEDRLFNPLARYLLAHPQHRSIRVGMHNGVLQICESESLKAGPAAGGSGGRGSAEGDLRGA